MRRDAQRLQDMVDAADMIAVYLSGVDQDRFLASSLLQDAVLRQFLVLGEAAFRVSAGLRDRSPQIPWQQIAGLRHRLVHNYFGIDLDMVWQIASRRVPELRTLVSDLLHSQSFQEPYGA